MRAAVHRSPPRASRPAARSNLERNLQAPRRSTRTSVVLVRQASSWQARRREQALHGRIPGLQRHLTVVTQNRSALSPAFGLFDEVDEGGLLDFGGGGEGCLVA